MINTLMSVFIFVAGMLTYRYLLQPKNEAVTPTCQSPVAEREIQKTPRQEPKPRFVAAVPVPQADPLQVKKPEVRKQVVDFNLTESIVVQMEHDWNDLPLQAEARREDRGWRLLKVAPESVFYRAGLRAGDLVTTDFLDRFRNSNTDMVNRVEQILNRITR